MNEPIPGVVARLLQSKTQLALPAFRATSE